MVSYKMSVSGRYASIIIGIVLLILVLNWNTMIFLPIARGFMIGSDNSASEGDIGISGASDGTSTKMDMGYERPLIEGKLGMPRLFYDMMRGGNIDFFNLTFDNFSLRYINVVMTQYAIYDKDNGNVIFDLTNQKDGDGHEKGTEEVQRNKDISKEVISEKPRIEKKRFPVLGVEKRDYEVWNPAAGANIHAEYKGEDVIKGRKVYIYETVLDNITPKGGTPLTPSTVFDSKDNNSNRDITISGSLSDFGDIVLKYSEKTRYYLDVETSAPLDIYINSRSAVIMPDFTRLLVTETHKTTRSKGSIWTNNEYFPFIKEERDVICEKHKRVYLLEDNEDIAIFETWSVLYDANTGEKLPDDQQPKDYEKFAVNRTTYRYEPRYGNSPRTGYYAFPIGKVEPKDYPTWDPMINKNNIIRYVTTVNHHGMECYLFEMYEINEDYNIQGPLVPVPIMVGEGAGDYKYDGVIRYWVDTRSGIPIDFYLNGTISVTTTKGVERVKVPVASFEFNFTMAEVEFMKLIARLYSRLLIPMSKSYMHIFVIDIRFSSELQSIIVNILNEYQIYLDFGRVYARLAVAVCGVYLICKPIYKFRKEKRYGIPVTPIEYKLRRKGRW